MNNRSLALVPKGRLRRIHTIENAVKITGALGISLASAIKYVRAGRGAQIPCDVCVDACLWSRDYHKAILESRTDVDLITTLLLAAAEKVYVPEIDFVELQLSQIEHLRYKVKKEELKKSATQPDEVVKWLQKAAIKTQKGNETMKKYNLGFISDVQFFNHVKEMVERLTESMDLKKFSKNIIDPIKMTVEMHTYQISLEEAVAREIARQLGKTVEGAIGWFHQNIFKYVPGWQIQKDGVDVVNDKMTVFGFFVRENTPTHGGIDVSRMAKGIVIGNPNAKVFLINSQSDGCEAVNPMLSAYGTPCKGTDRGFVNQVTVPQFYEVVGGSHDVYLRVSKCLDEALQAIGLGNILKHKIDKCISETIR